MTKATSIRLSAGRYFSTQEAAKALGRTDSRIRQLIGKEELPAIKVGDRAYLIRECEIRKILSRRPA